MSKTVVMVGSLDTKGQEFAYVNKLIEAEGLDTLVIDIGVMGEPALEPDVKRDAVAEAGGGDLAYLASGEHKDEAMRVMAAGLAVVVRALYDKGVVGGILGMGGGGNTSIATSGMRALPVGVPKVMVSTLAGGDVSAYAGTRDITFMPSIVDVSGVNSISRQIYANAAGAIAGMVKMEAPPAGEEKPLVTASMFGNTTTCVDRARGVVEGGGLRGTGLPRHRHRRQDHGKPHCRWLYRRLPGYHHHRAGRRGVRRCVKRRPGALHGRFAGGYPGRPGPWLRGHGQLLGHRHRS
jgi:uncharacterized protein (UPF0261 family)